MSEHEEELRELGKQLPWDRPDDARREAVRSSLLVAASTSDERVRTRWFVVGGAFATGAIAAAAAMLLVMRSGGERVQAQPKAEIEASTSADFERTVTRTEHGVDELVRVHTGKISLAVGALPIGDRVRVATRDAEVEGEGSYDVSVANDAIREVTVKQGRATVRVARQQAVFLAAGETWKAPVIAATAEVVPPNEPLMAKPEPAPTLERRPSNAIAPAHVAPLQTESPSISPREAPSVNASTESPAPAEHARATAQDHVAVTTPVVMPPELPKPSSTSVIETHFQTGWQLLKAGKAAEAARELGLAADADNDNPLAADARYFQAIALTKIGRKTEAEHALVAFLDHAKQSLRRGRAAVMLARLIAERGDAKSARAWFEAARNDADPSVAAAARAGLDALHE
jgi:hypothetical protein